MPMVALSLRQVATLLRPLGLAPGLASPLVATRGAAPLDHGDAAAQALIEAKLAGETARGELRVNHFVGSVLAACCHPDEVLWVSTATPEAAFVVCRLGPLIAECTPRPDGRVKLSFPLSRSQVLLAVTSALSGERPEPPPLGFRFRGPATDAFVLRTAVDAGGLARADLAAAVAAALADPARTIAFAALVGADALRALDIADDLDGPLGRLTAAGHLAVDGDRVVPSDAAAHLLGTPVVAEFAVGRKEVHDGCLRERELRVYRVGERTLVLQVLPEDGRPVVDLGERTRAQVRTMVGALLLDEKVRDGPPQGIGSKMEVT